MKKRKLTAAEWDAVGKLAYDIKTRDMPTLLDAVSGAVHARTMDHLIKAIHYMDLFRCDAEEDMFKQGVESIEVFYRHVREEREAKP